MQRKDVEDEAARLKERKKTSDTVVVKEDVQRGDVTGSFS